MKRFIWLIYKEFFKGAKIGNGTSETIDGLMLLALDLSYKELRLIFGYSKNPTHNLNKELLENSRNYLNEDV